MMTDKNTFRCKDLMISAAFIACDVPLLNLEYRGHFFDFIFDDPARCKDIERQWWLGNLRVYATKYAEAIKRLKNLVYAKKDELGR